MNKEATIFVTVPESLAMNAAIADEVPYILEDDDPFFFQFGGFEEFQMKAEVAMIKSRQQARDRHANHVANWK